MSRSPLAEAAAEYLNLGLPVIALTGKMPNGKVHRHGLHEPIVGLVENDSDWSLLADAFDHPETTGVAIVIPYPYVVVDIDGPVGAEQWQELIGGLDLDATTWVAKTARGLHLWYSCTTPTGTIVLGDKLDLKGQGGYVAAPPSVHPDGPIYEWLSAPSASEPPKEVPEQLARRIEDHVFDRDMAMESKRVRAIAWGPKYVPGDTVFFAQASHDALIEGMKTAADGNRNNYLHWAAATLAEEGGSDEEFELLAKTALAVGLDSVEVKRTIRSARRAHGED